MKIFDVTCVGCGSYRTRWAIALPWGHLVGCVPCHKLYADNNVDEDIRGFVEGSIEWQERYLPRIGIAPGRGDEGTV